MNVQVVRQVCVPILDKVPQPLRKALHPTPGDVESILLISTSTLAPRTIARSHQGPTLTAQQLPDAICFTCCIAFSSARANFTMTRKAYSLQRGTVIMCLLRKVEQGPTFESWG